MAKWIMIAIKQLTNNLTRLSFKSTSVIICHTGNIVRELIQDVIITYAIFIYSIYPIRYELGILTEAKFVFFVVFVYLLDLFYAIAAASVQGRWSVLLIYCPSFRPTLLTYSPQASFTLMLLFNQKLKFQFADLTLFILTPLIRHNESSKYSLIHS